MFRLTNTALSQCNIQDSKQYKILWLKKIQKQWFRKLLSSPDKFFITQISTGMACHCSPIKKLTSTIEALISPASRTMYATPCCSFLMQSYTNKRMKINFKHIVVNHHKHVQCTHRIILSTDLCYT